MSNKDNAKQKLQNQEQKTAAKRDQDRGAQSGDDYRSENLRDSKMMAHLLDALENGRDIGHFGRLTFVLVARHFLAEDEMLELLTNQPEMDEKEARVMIRQAQERGYNPPRRERILQWMEQQDFPICPDAQDPNGCNVYRDLKFPDEIYDQIEDFWEEKAEAEDEG